MANQPTNNQAPDFGAGASAVVTISDAPAPQPIKKRRLTQKQTKFVKGVAKGMPAYKAAAEAYDAKDLTVANAIAVENLQKPSIREALDAALEKAGITLEKAIEPIQSALEYQDPNGDERAELDMRLKGSDRALKLMGALQQDKEPAAPNTINFIGNNLFVKKDAA